MPALQLVRVGNALPEDFATLRRAAETEGHRHMAQLEDELALGAQRFDRDGEVLLAAFADGRLVGIGGLTLEPEAPEALRMRRLYVLPSARRSGVATAIANALSQEAVGRARLLTVHAGNPDAERFWETMGYERVAGRPWSHQTPSA